MKIGEPPVEREKGPSQDEPSSIKVRKDIRQRTYEFALQAIALGRCLPEANDAKVLSRQLLRSVTSIGANVGEEAQSAYSKHDFVYKMNIALQEARETHYWLRLIRDSGIVESGSLDGIINESEELKKILGAIVSKARGTAKHLIKER